jgi:hypothetical protein
MRLAWALGPMMVCLAWPGCLDGDALRPLETRVPEPAVAPGSWWTVREREWSSHGPAWRDVRHTVWVVGSRQVHGEARPLAVVTEAAEPPDRLDPPFAERPFRLVLLPPGSPIVQGGVASRANVAALADVPECRGVEACTTEALLAWSYATVVLPFPLGSDYHRSTPNDGAGGSSSTTGTVLGQGKRTFPFGKEAVVRVEEHREFHGFENSGTSDTTIDYAPAFGVVVREDERVCGFPAFSRCGSSERRLLEVVAHGHVNAPSVAEVGRWFTVQQAEAVYATAVQAGGHGANVALGEALWANVTFAGLRPGDMVEMAWRPHGLSAETLVMPGSNTSYVPARPGWHEVTMLVRSPQEVQIATSPAELRAGYDATVRVACGTTCPPVTVPMGSLLDRIAVTASSEALLGNGRLELRDPSGAIRAGCTCLELVLPLMRRNETAAWSAHWIPDVAIAGQAVLLRVEVE